MTAQPSALILTNRSEIRRKIETYLNGLELRTTATDQFEELSWELQKDAPVVVFLDVASCAPRSPVEVLKICRSFYPGLAIYVLGNRENLETGLEFMRNGADDYLTPPWLPERTAERIRQEICRWRENGDRKDPPINATDTIITRDPKMQALFEYCRRVARSPRPVLITGETGVGKERFAEYLHRLSRRPGKLVAVNIAGLDDTLLSDTLFGHRRGAYTGAVGDRAGALEKANGGTVLIDEIGDLSLSAQVKLLRLLQEMEFSPLGSDEVRQCTARIILATHRDLFELQRIGKFRADLYYRIYTHRLEIPPLRDRVGDLPLLLKYFIEKSAEALEQPVPATPPELLPLLRNYSFPGNVRELESMVFNAVSCCATGELAAADFTSHMDSLDGTLPLLGEPVEAMIRRFPRLPSLKNIDRLLVAEALARTGGNQSLAAKMLGITPQAINSRLKKLRNEDADE